MLLMLSVSQRGQLGWRPLLAQDNRTSPIEADDVERVPARPDDIPTLQHAVSITRDVAAIVLAPEGAARLTASLRLLLLLPLRSLVPLRRQLR